MKTFARLFLTLVGFGLATTMIGYLDPEAIDAIGFSIFYLALLVGATSLFLLLQLSFLQAILLALLFTSFLLLQHLRLFRWWLGLLLVILAITIERNVSSS